MIYLIGGSPRCGKTMIANKLSKKLGISLMSADTLESIAASYISENERPKLFPKSVMREKTKQSNDEFYALYTSKQITKAYIQQARASWKAIEMMVLASDKEGHDIIIEGHQIHPRLIAKLQRRHPGVIRAVVLTRFDKKSIVSDSRKNKAKNDWFLQKTSDRSTHYKIAEMITDYSVFFDKEAKNYKIKMFDMDKDFHKQISNVISWLTDIKA